jgi:hypothetical protein
MANKTAKTTIINKFYSQNHCNYTAAANECSQQTRSFKDEGYMQIQKHRQMAVFLNKLGLILKIKLLE